MLNATLQDVVHHLRASNRLPQAPAHDYVEYLPIHVRCRTDPNEKDGSLQASMVVGRGFWLFIMRAILNGPASHVLHDHHWSILAPHRDLKWYTSDDPVTLLNYYEDGRYDFEGGSGSNGTEIFFPLSPSHVLYTRIGYRPPRRGLQFSWEHTRRIRHLIAEHAYRVILAESPDDEIPLIRPRVVNYKQFREEESWRQRWHEEQKAAERQLTEAHQPLI